MKITLKTNKEMRVQVSPHFFHISFKRVQVREFGACCASRISLPCLMWKCVYSKNAFKDVYLCAGGSVKVMIMPLIGLD